MENFDAQKLKTIFLAGCHALNEKREEINELNVFPVPDGDTGTNMTMTVISSAKEVLKAEETFEGICHAITSGSLRGARGNSGVILSQLFRGFFKVIREKESWLSISDLALAFENASVSAYKAVMKPKEGTILTVSAALARSARENDKETDVRAFLTKVVKDGEEALRHTPDLLPVLKQAGVVDSGGQGLMTFLSGALAAINGASVSLTLPVMGEETTSSAAVDSSALSTSDIEFGYCTEFIVKAKESFPEKKEAQFRSFLESIGNCVICVADEGVVKVHVHTNHPGEAIEKGLSYGELSSLKIDNMREEHEEKLFREKENASVDLFDPGTAKEDGFITVCAGDGLTELFRELGADGIISGGQTMNPSTEDFLNAIRRINAKRVYLFPNNGNVILAATQAAGLIENREVIVIPTTTVVEGITACLHFVPGESRDTNVEMMKNAMSLTDTIEVTYAVRDAVLDGVTVHKDDYMAIGGKKILACEKKLKVCVKNAIAAMTKENTALITLYFGDGVKESDAESLAEEIRKTVSPAVDVEAVYGGQPVYSYFIAVEAGE